jgi:hypothetical protein
MLLPLISIVPEAVRARVLPCAAEGRDVGYGEQRLPLQLSLDCQTPAHLLRAARLHILHPTIFQDERQDAVIHLP